MQDQKTATPTTLTTLTTIFSDVLANLAFMFTDEERPEPSTGDLWLETTITYSGQRSAINDRQSAEWVREGNLAPAAQSAPSRRESAPSRDREGTLRFRCSSDFSILLAANLLGIDPQDEDAEAKAKDAVKEFMNIICGQLVTAIHGSNEVFDLTIPQIRELPEAPNLGASDDSESSTLCVDGHVIQLALTTGD